MQSFCCPISGPDAWTIDTRLAGRHSQTMHSSSQHSTQHQVSSAIFDFTDFRIGFLVRVLNNLLVWPLAPSQSYISLEVPWAGALIEQIVHLVQISVNLVIQYGGQGVMHTSSKLNPFVSGTKKNIRTQSGKPKPKNTRPTLAPRFP